MDGEPGKVQEAQGEIGQEGKGNYYLLEVDMSYHDNLHNLHNNLPFMCEKMKISGVQKLVPNLFHKKKYVMHIMALDQTLKHRLVLQRIHQAIEFNQSP